MVRGDWERYSYYTELHAELAAQEDVERERAASKKRREGTVRCVCACAWRECAYRVRSNWAGLGEGAGQVCACWLGAVGCSGWQPARC